MSATGSPAGPRHPLPLPLPTPALVEGGLGLRPWVVGDVDHLVAAWNDPEIARWTAVPAVRDADAARRWIRGDADRRARGLSLDLVIDVAGDVAGEVGLFDFDPSRGTAEIGWWIAAGHRRRRLAAGAASLLGGWALQELALGVVVARCHPDNPASAAVARAAGFELTGEVDGVEVWQLA